MHYDISVTIIKIILVINKYYYLNIYCFMVHTKREKVIKMEKFYRPNVF